VRGGAVEEVARRGGAEHVCGGGRPGAALPGSAGQATVETLALAPAILAIGLAILQLLAVGYASVLAGNAAEAGALALAGGTDARDAARQALPGWSRTRAEVDVRGGSVAVRMRPPSPLKALADELEVSATASVEAP
jgi:hypothetical protein